MLKKRLFSIACVITIATAMCAVTGCGSSQSSGASQQGAGKVDYSALPKIDMPDKKIVLLTQSEEKATTYKEHYGGEVESILVSDKEIFTRFMTMVMSEERVDVFWNYLKPALATQGYLKNLDEYIDFNQPLWADVKDINNLLQDKEGKHYCAIPGVQRNMCLWYNTEIFEEYGLDTPESYVKAGTWDWNVLRDMAIKLTTAPGSDGKSSLYGMCVDEVDAFLYSCGKHIISLNGDGTATNNIMSEEIARAVKFATDLNVVDKVLYTNNDGREMFKQGKVAMISGGVWYRTLWPDMMRSGAAMFVPFPKDPNADQYYVQQQSDGYMIPSTAQNVAGACAFIATKRFDFMDTSKKERTLAEMKEAYGWNEKHQEMFEKYCGSKDKVGVPISYIPFETGEYYGDLFARPSLGEPWSTIAAEIAPKIDEKIAIAYEK